MIRCYIKNDETYNSICFHHDGSYLPYNKAKCVIFPKGKTTWEDFKRPFKDGDIIFTHADCTRIGLGNTWISIFEENRNGGVATYVDYCNEGKDFYTYLDDKGLLCLNEDIIQQRLATEAEKVILFQAIRANGFNWNPESKTLNKLIEPKFKIGDRVKEKKSYISGTITDIDDDSYKVEYKSGGISFFSIKFQNDLELVPNHKFKVGDVIKAENQFYKYKIKEITNTHYTLESIPGAYIHNRLICKDKNWELVPDKFDITTLKPFESRVLVRTGNRKWVAAFYSHYNTDSSLHYCVAGGLWYEQCIPYDGNEYLLNTNDDCDDFYKNW
jgi:hypothetical protein